MKRIYWDRNNEPLRIDIASVLYSIKSHDGSNGLIMDSITTNEIMADSEGLIAFDSLVVPYARLEKKMRTLVRVMDRASKDLDVNEVNLTAPFKRNGTTQVAAVFDLSDGQTVSIFFHNPDVIPKKIGANDEVVSWKWLLNKKDITIVVAPEKGKDLDVRSVATRIMKLADKNSAAFIRANKNKAEKAKQIEEIKTEISSLEEQVKTLDKEIEQAKIDAEQRKVDAENLAKEQAKQEEQNKVIGEMKTFNIIKKNRKFFDVRLNGYKAKLLIDDKSKDLELGENTLLVEDISVRSKYGTDLKFKLVQSPQESADTGIVTLETEYNSEIVKEARRLGGKWDAENKVWVFNGLVANEVDALDAKYNSEKVGVEITYLKDDYKDKGALEIAGYPVAKATGRDSGAKVNTGISVIKKGFDSGGSRANWKTTVERGTVIRMYLPEFVLDDLDKSMFSFKIIDGALGGSSNSSDSVVKESVNKLQEIIDGNLDSIDLMELLDIIDKTANKLIDAGVVEDYNEYDDLIGKAAEKWAELDEKING